jgi:uncharacterized protein YqjF (DUF2071 family)
MKYSREMHQTVQSSHRTKVDAERVFLTANWRYLAMLNYEVDPKLLIAFVPSGTELDSWEGKIFLSLIGFQFLRTRLFGFLPIPHHTNFEEVNLRFYVSRQVGAEVRRGVVFIRELVPRGAIAFVARSFYNENYVAVPMTHNVREVENGDLRVNYRWRSEHQWSEINVKTEGDPEVPSEGSAEQFITEHYWGYAAQPSGPSVEYRVTHPTWRVWQARESSFKGNAEKLYGNEFSGILRGQPHSAFLAEGSNVAVMRGRRI